MHSSFGSQFLFYNPTKGVDISSHWFVGGCREATGRVGTRKPVNQLQFPWAQQRWRCHCLSAGLAHGSRAGHVKANERIDSVIRWLHSIS